MQKRARQIEKVITGVLQLCRAESGGIVWVDQLDAAAFSDGEKIYLPRPTGEHEGEFDLLLALALREVARLTHSDAHRFAMSGSDAALAALLEDVRVKKAIASEYRGSPAIFGNAYTLSEDLLGQTGKDMTAEAIKRRAVYLAANDALHGSDYRHKLGPEYFRSVTGFSEEVLRDVMDAAGKAGDTTSTNEAFDLARQLSELLEKKEPLAFPHEADQQGQSDGQPQDGEPQGEADQQGQSGGQPQGGEPQGKAEQQGQPDGQPRSESGAGIDYLSDALAKLRGFDKASPIKDQPQTQTAQEAQPVTVEELEVMQALLDGQVDATGALECLEQVADKSSPEDEGELEVALAELVSVDVGGGAGSSSLADEMNEGSNLLPPVPARLVSVLLRELQDRRRRPSKLAYSGSRVDASRIWRIKSMGDAKVFRKKAAVHGVDAGVSILLDRSGSMDGDMEQAASITYAMAVALQRVNGVKTSIDVFPGLLEPVREVLPFRQNPRLIKSELESVTAMGGTPTAQALAFRLQKLIELRCEKRVVFVITDGRPDSQEDMEKVLHRAEREDIAVIGVGLGSNSAVRSTFAVSVTVDSVEDLPDALEQLFRNTLVERLAA
jgi:Mg-chelatase subunit ChlD